MPFPYTFPITWLNFPKARGRVRQIYRHAAPGVFEMWFGFEPITPSTPMALMQPSLPHEEPIPEWAVEMRKNMYLNDKSLSDRLTSIEYSMTDQVDENYFRVYTFYWRVIDKDTTLTTGDGQDTEPIPSELDGMILIDADAYVDTASTSGLPEIAIYNLTDSVDMLSTLITIDENEKDSYTATTPAIVNTDNDDVVSGDILRVDIDTAGNAKGLVILLRFRKG